MKLRNIGGRTPNEQVLTSIRAYEWPKEQPLEAKTQWLDDISCLFQRDQLPAQKASQNLFSFEGMERYKDVTSLITEELLASSTSSTIFVWLDFILSYSGKSSLHNEIGTACLSLDRLPAEFESQINGAIELTSQTQERVSYVYKKIHHEGTHNGYTYQISRIELLKEKDAICRYELLWEHTQEGIALD